MSRLQTITEPDKNIYINELEKAITSLAPVKVAGSHALPAKFLKQGKMSVTQTSV